MAKHPTLIQPTQEQLDALENVEYKPFLTEANYAQAIQAHIDSVAQSKQYGDGVSLASYASSTIAQWKNEADVFIAWRDAVWTYAFNLMEQVKAGQVPAPTIEEVIALLPQITW